jgi:hypothetical protein
MNLPPPFTQGEIEAICEVAQASAIASYGWEDRGTAPTGYIQGMAVAYAYAVRKLWAGDPNVIEMAKANSGDEDVDVLEWYGEEFAEHGMDTDVDGVDTLRNLFSFMIGLGMRESSGKYCEGRDMSADNVEPETAEAGLFQQSWNSSSASDAIFALFDQYEFALAAEGDPPQCARPVFAQDVSCSSDDWSNYGSGQGAQYQELAKSCPQCAVEMAAIGLRVLRQHWGPVNRREVELLPEAEDMLWEIQSMVQQWYGDAAPVEVTIRVFADRPVKVTVINETDGAEI